MADDAKSESRLALLEDVAAGFDLILGCLKQSDCPELFDVMPDNDGHHDLTQTKDTERDGIMAKAVRARQLLKVQQPDDHQPSAQNMDASSQCPPNISSMPEGHPDIQTQNTIGPSCPFAPTMAALPQQMQAALSNTAAPSAPKSVPTPPDTEQHDGVSKCPIRMLDERPPEEIAEYFETHKHEIPRSHEICVKRYQSNEQSIRLLDAKYGNLVNMIQGLGMKHQPLLPTKEGQEGHVEKPVSNPSVEAWAGNLPLENQRQERNEIDLAEREGRFDRELREIRVGESPSRPWGIPVPDVNIDHLNHDPKAPAPEKPSSQNGQPSEAKVEPSTSTQRKADRRVLDSPPPQMIFNGPVFFGYPAEQAAFLMSRLGGNCPANET